jgi:hypothetical protein
MEYTYLPNTFLAILNISQALPHTTAKTIALQIPHHTVRDYFSLYFIKYSFIIQKNVSMKTVELDDLYNLFSHMSV